jgi:hypothetical protein
LYVKAIGLVEGDGRRRGGRRRKEAKKEYEFVLRRAALNEEQEAALEKGGTMYDTTYGISTASIYDRHVYVPVRFILSLGPTGFVSHMSQGFDGGRVHNLDPGRYYDQPTYLNRHYQCTMVLSSDPLPVDHKSSPGNKLANTKAD